MSRRIFTVPLDTVAAQIARQVKELDLRLEPDPMQGAQQVGREHERALQDRDDKQVLRLRRGDLPRQRLRSFGDRPLVVENLDLSLAAHEGVSVNASFIARLGEFYQNLANAGRRRRQSRSEWDALASSRLSSWAPAPSRHRAPARLRRRAPSADPAPAFAVAQILDLACDQELSLAFGLLRNRRANIWRSMSRED